MLRNQNYISKVEMTHRINAGKPFLVDSKKDRQRAIDAAAYAGKSITTRVYGWQYWVLFYDIPKGMDGKLNGKVTLQKQPKQIAATPPKFKRNGKAKTV